MKIKGQLDVVTAHWNQYHPLQLILDFSLELSKSRWLRLIMKQKKKPLGLNKALREDSSSTDEDEATGCDEFIPASDTTPQNRTPLPTLAMACERFHVSDRVGAAIASAALVDYGIITAD